MARPEECTRRGTGAGARRAVSAAARRTVVVAVIVVAGLLGGSGPVGWLVPLTGAAADTVRDRQWQLGFLRIEDAWQYSTGRGVTVAVIDSGVAADHPDLRGQVLPGTDFVNGDSDGRTDQVGHGTTVAALIAGRADDHDGVVGLAYDAKILPIRVLDAQNQYHSATQVAAAVRWAVDHRARVINLSLGSAESAPVLASALRYAFDHDVVVVACVGNQANHRGGQVWHPAREPGVIAVSGVARDGEFWAGSLAGYQTVLSAPATEIIGARPQGMYWRVQGTSFATPLVSATVALVRARYPDLPAADVINRLIRTSWDLGPVGRDSRYGYGVVNPARALTAPLDAVDGNPLLSSTGEVNGGPNPGAGPDGPGQPDAVGVPAVQPEVAAGPTPTNPSLPRTGLLLLGTLILVALLVMAALVQPFNRSPEQPGTQRPS